jgi:hypothetical protein
VGNRYGSFYQKENSMLYPDSVTLQEFRKALDIRIPKHVFIEKFVKHDYDNYVNAISKIYTEYFDKNEVAEDKILGIKQKIRKDFDQSYHFAQPQHKYIFNFLELIHKLNTNNAIISFDNFDDIRTNLISQWAGFMFEALDKNSRISASKLLPLEEKIDKIDKHLQELLTTKKTQTENGKITFDISKFSSDINFQKFEELKSKINNIISDLIRPPNYSNKFRGIFYDNLSTEWAKKWATSLPSLLKKYKWSPTIEFRDLFGGHGVNVGWFVPWKDIPYIQVFEFNEIYKNLSKDEQEGLLNTIIKKFEPLIQIKDESTSNSDDIPF